MKKGPLVRIEIRPGHFVKMYEADAIERGLIPGKAKAPPPNKIKQPEGNKEKGDQATRQPGDASIADQGTVQPDEPESVSGAIEKEFSSDFTIIDGVGPATARALVANGITTFEQLRATGSFDFLPAKAVQAIEDWLEATGNGG